MLDATSRLSAQKSFFQSKKMVAALIASTQALLVVLGSFILAVKQPAVMTPEVLQSIILMFGGCFAAVWPIALGAAGFVEHGETKWIANSVKRALAPATPTTEPVMPSEAELIRSGP